MSEPIVLLAWELGQGLGHVMPAKRLAIELKRRGMRCVLAISNLAAAREIGLGGNDVLQAPCWPMQTGDKKAKLDYVPATVGEFLGEAIFSDVGVIARQIEGWQALAQDVRPDIVAADYAPGAHLAFGGSIPVVAYGVGYCVPPTHLPEFPRLGSLVRPLRESEESVLARINEAVRRTGGTPLAHYPQIFEAAGHAVLSLPLLDPYRKLRTSPQFGPLLPKRPRLRAPGEGIFVYLWEKSQRHEWIIEGIARAGGPGMVYIPRMREETAAKLEATGFRALSKPADLDDAFASAGLIVHHGGHGIACAALAAGLPQVAITYDQEKVLTAGSLERLGVARHVPLAVSNPRAVHLAITEMRASTDARRRARELAVESANWFDTNAEVRTVDLIEDCLGRR